MTQDDKSSSKLTLGQKIKYGLLSLIIFIAAGVFLIALPMRCYFNREESKKEEMMAIANNPTEQRKITDNMVRNMVRIDGGEFLMGLPEEEEIKLSGSAVPQHSVTLSDYYIGRFEVTQREWAAVMGTAPSRQLAPDNPVDNVSWEDCQKFIDKLNSITGYKFRLPTEAEWEYAAKGGKKGKGCTYSGNNDLKEVGWYEGNSQRDIGRGENRQEYIETRPVGQKRPNELGLYDMSGNVEEWCSDFYDFYPKAAEVNPQGPKNGKWHVMRGGNYKEIKYYCEVTRRRYAEPTFKSYQCGLRLAVTNL